MELYPSKEVTKKIYDLLSAGDITEILKFSQINNGENIHIRDHTIVIEALDFRNQNILRFRFGISERYKLTFRRCVFNHFNWFGKLPKSPGIELDECKIGREVIISGEKTDDLLLNINSESPIRVIVKQNICNSIVIKYFPTETTGWVIPTNIIIDDNDCTDLQLTSTGSFPDDTTKKINSVRVVANTIKSELLLKQIDDSILDINYNLSVSKITVKYIQNSELRIDDNKDNIGSLSLISSKLTNIEFLNSNLEDTILSCYETDLRYLKVTNCELPVTIDSDTSNQIEKYTNIRNTARTFKNISIEAGNTYKVPLYKKLEYENQLKILNTKKGKLKERFAIWFNLYTNEYGLNYFRPIKLYLLVWLIGYCIILLLNINLIKLDWDYLSLIIKELFLFLNPTYKLEIYKCLNVNPFTGMFDYLIKILQVTMGFQTVFAFRQFIR